MIHRVSPSEARRLSRLATTVSGVLRQRFGARRFYTADEVEAACNECHVATNDHAYAAAMFVEPDQAQGFLQRLGSSKTSIELRKFMAGQLFFYDLPNGSFNDATIDFHRPAEAAGTLSNSFYDESDFDAGGGDGDGE